MESGKAAVLVAKVLWQCLSELGSQEAVRDLWTQSRLDWASLGMRAEDLGEFLERQVILNWVVLNESSYLFFSKQNLGFLQLEETPPYHIADLQELLSSVQTNKDIMTSLEVSQFTILLNIITEPCFIVFRNSSPMISTLQDLSGVWPLV